MQQPAQRDILRVLHGGSMKLLLGDARPLGRVPLDIQEDVHLLLRANTEDAVSVEQKIASSRVSTAAGRFAHVLFLVTGVVLFASVEITSP